MSSVPEESTPEQRSRDEMHRNIELANSYRTQAIILLLALSTGALAFTITFRPTLAGKVDESCLWTGWIFLVISIIGGVVQLLCWESFYMSYRDYDRPGRPEGGETRRRLLTELRRFMKFCQFLGFVIGMIAIGLFVLPNFSHAIPGK